MSTQQAAPASNSSTPPTGETTTGDTVILASGHEIPVNPNGFVERFLVEAKNRGVEVTAASIEMAQKNLAEGNYTTAKLAGKKRTRSEGDEENDTATDDSVAIAVPQHSKPTLVQLNCLAECEPFGFMHLPAVDNCPVQGLQGLADMVRKLIATKKKGLQATTALVVMNTSGVGKTFGSLAVETLLNPKNCTQGNQQGPDYYMPLYIGFNSGFSLTGPETVLLKDTSLEAYGRVCGVIGRRLLFQLKALDSATGSLDAVLRDSTHWLAKTPLPVGNTSTFRTECRFPMVTDIDDDDFLRECARLIEALAKRSVNRKLSVLLIIDEAQLLDDYIQPTQDTGGARCALRFGRRLQLLLENAGRASLLPFMTGINPVTFLPDSTTGTNVEFSEPLLTLTDFRAALEAERSDFATQGTLNGQDFTQREVHRIATLMYPVLRDALGFVRQEYIKVLIPQDISPLWLIATCGSELVERKYWNRAVPAIFYKKEFVPKLSLAQFVTMLTSVQFLAQSVRIVLRNMDTQFVKVADVQTVWLPAGFEEYSFYVMTILFAMVNVAPVKGDFAEQERTDYELCRRNLGDTFGWLKNSFKRVVSVFFLKTGAASCHLPSCKAGSHSEAFKLKGNATEHKLHAELGNQIRQLLLDSGDCFALWCGGNAPVDFVWIIRKSAKGVKSVKVEVFLADAKHKDDSKKKISVVKGNSDEKDMPTKFLLVANYLYAALKAECGMEVVQERFALITSGVAANETARIITNRAARREEDKISDEIHKIEATPTTTVYASFVPSKKDLTLGEEVVMLTRETFNIPPLSEFLFGPEITK